MHDLELLLEFLEAEITTNLNFEFVQVGISHARRVLRTGTGLHSLRLLCSCAGMGFSDLGAWPISKTRLEHSTSSSLLLPWSLLSLTGALPSCLPLQALLRVTLQVHGSTIMEQEGLRERAERIHARLGASWRRVDGLLQGVRCMLGLLGGIQA